MKKYLSTSAALLLTTSVATAGGLDRGGLPFDILYADTGADGAYIELSYGLVQPSVSGTLSLAPLETGNVGVDYGTMTFGFKGEINDQLSVALLMNEPYGADVAYDETDPGYPIAGSVGEFNSRGITAMARYKLNENMSVHAGIRSVTIDADITVVDPDGTYDAQYDADTATGYILGAAYEKPEIALRVALTYTSELEFSHVTHLTGVPDAAVAPTEYTMPQTLTLDFQSGVAANTLVFGQVRYSENSAININSAFYPANPLIGFDDDSISYKIGVGRRFTDELAGSISISYEKANGGEASNLAPTDGSIGIQIGGSYDMGNGMEISGGVGYTMVGDADTSIASFSDNSAIGVGVKVGYSF